MTSRATDDTAGGTPVPPAAWSPVGAFPPPGPGRGARRWMPVVVSLIVQVPFALLSLGHVLNADPAGAPATGPFQDLVGVGYAPVWIAQVVLAAGSALALLVIRRFPGRVAVAIIAAAALAAFLVPVGPPFISVAFAVVLAVRYGARLPTYIALAAAWMLVVFLGPLAGYAWAPRIVAPITLALFAIVGVAEFSKRRGDLRRALIAENEERRRRERRRQEAAGREERVRIARDLHDVIGHSLSQITVQANAGLYLMDRDPAEARHALENVKQTSAAALAEVRSVLGILREGGGADEQAAARTPTAGLDQLSDLVGTVRAGGLDVSVTVPDAPGDIPSRVGASVYRIVQESLTNVVRHSDARTARVSVSRGEDRSVVVVIEDDGPARPHQSDGNDDGSGNGLLGMRERAELLGGSFSARPAATGGWRVIAVLPVDADPPHTTPPLEPREKDGPT